MIASLRPIRWRITWTSLLVLVLALGSFYLNQWAYAYSDDECWWKLEPVQAGPAKAGAGNRIIIREVIPDGVAEAAGILDGDELVAIQGRKVAATGDGLNAAQRQINAMPEGRILVYTVHRAGETLHLPVRLVKPFDRAHCMRLITGLMFWALGLLVVVSSPQRKTSRHFYYLGLLFLLVGALGAGFQNTPPRPILVVMIGIQVLTGALLMPLMLHFFLRFPHPFELRRNRRFLKALYGSFAVIALTLGMFALFNLFRGDLLPLLGIDPRTPAPGGLILVLNVFGTLNGVLQGLAVGASCVFFWIGTFRLPPRQRRAVLPVLLLTTAVLLDLLALGVLGFLNRNGLVFRRQMWVFLLPMPLMPLAFAYAILRHRFFDVRSALLRWVSYFATLGLVVVVYLGALALAFAHWLQNIPPGWAGALIGLLALPLGWILRYLLLALRKGFRRDLGTAREIVLGALRENKNRFSEEALLRKLEEALREAFRPQLLLFLPVTDAALLLPAAEDAEGEEGRGPRRLVLPANLLRHARENRELVLGLGSDEADWIREQGSGLRSHIDALEAQVLVLVLVNDEPHAAILLGGKYAELDYSRDDRELLREMAMATGIVLETAVLHQRILDQGRLETELHTARRIQESLITSQAPATPGFQLALRLEPAFETGGDLLWVKRRPSGRWLAAVGDVSGKGLAAALYMSQAIALLEFATQREDRSLEDILAHLDETLRHLFSQRDFLTLTLLEWDEQGRYRLARAGHPAALLVKGSGPSEVQEVCPQGRGLGLRPQGCPDWGILEGVLQPREWLVLYSDGLTEAMNKQGEIYGEGRMKGLLQRLWGTGSGRAACEALFREVAHFETQNRDDRTLLILAREAA